MVFFKQFTDKEIKNLKTHEYNVLDQSILSTYVYRPLWKHVQAFVPEKVKPNHITLVGLFSMLFSGIMTFYFDPTLQNRPTALPLCNGICLFIYWLADGIDGFHARQTNQSSVLGQIMDHGCDSISAMIIVLAIASSLGLGLSSFTFSGLTCVMFGFFSAQVLESFSGQMTFGKVTAACEGLTVAFFLHLLSFFVPSIKGLPNLRIGDFEVTSEYYSYLVWVGILGLFMDTCLRCRKFLKSKDHIILFSQMMASVVSCLSLLFMISFFRDNSEPGKCWIYLVVCSNVFTNIYIEQLLGYLAKTRINFNVTFSGLALQILVLFTLFEEARPYTLLSLMGISTLQFLVRSASIINQISKHMGVCFV